MKRLSRWSLPLKRCMIRLARWPKRYGFGAQSPFAFRLITDVIGQRAPYYSYQELTEREKLYPSTPHPGCCRETLQMKRLLFRLVNFIQPSNCLSVGDASVSQLYLQAAKREMNFWHASSLDEIIQKLDEKVDLLYLHRVESPSLLREAFRLCAPLTTDQSLVVVQGIGYTPEMKQLWHELKGDPLVSVSFDLFDLGLLFFDRSKQRQHYKVSF